MKKTTTLLILLAIAFFSFGQKGPFQKIKVGELKMSEWQVSDSLQNFIAYYPAADRIEVSGDTISALKQLFHSMEDFWKIRDAAEKVLRYLTIDGRVTDKEKYSAAVKEYMKLKNKQ
jgi:hypothetical protein